MLIRNKENRTIAVAKGHGYTVEKVKKAMNFINHTGRNTTVQEWVDMYNYLKEANESVRGCKPCAASKYTAAVRNYAKFGYLTLLNEGHKPEEFMSEEKKVQEPIENEEKRIVLEEPKEDNTIEEVKEALSDVQEVEPVEVKESVEEEETVEPVQEVEEVQEEVAETVEEVEPQEEVLKKKRRSTKK